MRIFFESLTSLLVLGAVLGNAVSQERSEIMKVSTETINVTSTNFKEADMMDSKYTCDGKNISPGLNWLNAPKETKSFAVSVIDPDAPSGDFVHWLIYNIPPDTMSIPEGGPVPAGAKEATNDFGKKGYGGPCPPSGTHRYYFTVYALDTDNLNIADKRDFMRNMDQHAIARGHIMGKYSRRR